MAVVLPTKPELAVHQELKRRRIKFKAEVQIGVYCVDVLVESKKTIIFIDGCFWHACPVHFPKRKKKRTDAARIPYLSKCGYKVVLLWEHEIKEDICRAVSKAV